MEKATFAMGCFWGPEALFKKIPGVVDTTVGYTGGHIQNPTYDKVCSGTSGHAEAIEIIYDPKITNYEKLLDVFWSHHNPTTYNRQSPDIGEQYRAAVFYHDENQKKLAEETRQRLIDGKKYKDPIVTEITEATTFYPAEEYHQDYSDKNPTYVCHI